MSFMNFYIYKWIWIFILPKSQIEVEKNEAFLHTSICLWAYATQGVAWFCYLKPPVLGEHYRQNSIVIPHLYYHWREQNFSLCQNLTQNITSDIICGGNNLKIGTYFTLQQNPWTKLSILSLVPSNDRNF